MKDNTKTNTKNKTIKSEDVVEAIDAEQTPWYKEGSTPIGRVFSYGYASLKVVDIAARILTAAALYLKLNDNILNWGAAFLAATALWEIVISLLRAYGPQK